MATTDEYINRKLIGKGWEFPIRVRNGQLRWVGGEEKIRQSIWIILSTATGERLMLPEFGCGMHQMVFAPNTAQSHSVVQQQVREALIRWEPRIDVLDVHVEAPPEARNVLLIRIDYRIRSNNTVYNLVYPFYINEGPR